MSQLFKLSVAIAIVMLPESRCLLEQLPDGVVKVQQKSGNCQILLYDLPEHLVKVELLSAYSA